ncbi:MAG: STAS domain-containing protein [Candidatus Eremiobacteraeota bacterium]|nr:STAS domain-containing protein [Candidatus Eremiobacteraeota bacterium]
MYYKLSPQPQTPVTRGLLGAVDDAARKSERALTVGLDELSSLDTKAMNGLITALRRMRDTGGTVQLHVTRPDLLRTLSETGLDRVFSIVATPEEPRPKPERKRKSGGVKTGRMIVGGLTGVFMALLVVGGK